MCIWCGLMHPGLWGCQVQGKPSNQEMGQKLRYLIVASITHSIVFVLFCFGVIIYVVRDQRMTGVWSPLTVGSLLHRGLKNSYHGVSHLLTKNCKKSTCKHFKSLKLKTSQAWWHTHTPLIPTCERQRQENQEPKVLFSYLSSLKPASATQWDLVLKTNR